MLFSIIVPVYNAEKFIRRNIESVLTQTEGDFELLLVDDGSRDSSLAICNEYAAADSRIKVLHKENGGVSSARNYGLDNASGDYVMFIDADDYITPNALEICRIYVPEYDIVRFSAIEINTNGKEGTLTIPYAETLNEYIGQIIRRRTIVAVWGGIFRRSLFEQHNIRFNTDIALGEDWLVSGILASKATNIKIESEHHCYIYDRSNENSCTNNLTPEKTCKQLEVVRLLRETIPTGYNHQFNKTTYIITRELIDLFGMEEGRRQISAQCDRIITLDLPSILLLNVGFKKKWRMLKVWHFHRQALAKYRGAK